MRLFEKLLERPEKWTNYTAFGSNMPGRSFTSASYRYGFNGKENDPETGTPDYGMRIYNPGLGRFPSMDPLSNEYPWYTPYQFAGNKPIWAIDVEGLEETPATIVKSNYIAALDSTTYQDVIMTTVTSSLIKAEYVAGETSNEIATPPTGEPVTFTIWETELIVDGNGAVVGGSTTTKTIEYSAEDKNGKRNYSFREAGSTK